MKPRIIYNDDTVSLNVVAPPFSTDQIGSAQAVDGDHHHGTSGGGRAETGQRGQCQCESGFSHVAPRLLFCGAILGGFGRAFACDRRS